MYALLVAATLGQPQTVIPLTDATPQAGAVYRDVPGNRNLVALYVDGRLTGQWDKANGVYHAYLGRPGQWGPATRTPPHADRIPDQPCCGVDPAKVAAYDRQHGAYTLNGTTVNRQQAFQAIGAPDGVPQDAATPSLTAIGTPEECARVKAAYEASPYRGRFLWQDYRPTDAMVVKAVPPQAAAGTPAIFCQLPGGEVLERATTFTDAATLNAMLASSLRRINPNYDPSKDPQPGGGSPVAGLDPTVLILCGGMLAVALVMLATGRKRA